MVSGQFHYTKRDAFMPFLLAEILNFQGSAHLIGVGSLSILLLNSPLTLENTKFIAGELSLIVSLVLYLPIGLYEP
jgi:hypothetical protein